jgi:hypothetical protein
MRPLILVPRPMHAVLRRRRPRPVEPGHMSESGEATPAKADPRRAAQAAADAARAAADAATRFGGPLAAWRPRGAIRQATAAAASASAAAEADPPRPRDAARWAIEAARHTIDVAAAAAAPAQYETVGFARDGLAAAQNAARLTRDDAEAASDVAQELTALTRAINAVADTRRELSGTQRTAPARLDAVVRSLVAIVLTGTLIALVLFSSTSTEAATAGETLALAGLGFYFGSASRQRVLRERPTEATAVSALSAPSEAEYDPKPTQQGGWEEG